MFVKVHLYGLFFAISWKAANKNNGKVTYSGLLRFCFRFMLNFREDCKTNFHARNDLMEVA
jgi:hypothetical protein